VSHEDLICEVSSAIALAGWQGLADNPDLVERIMSTGAVPDMHPDAAAVIEAIHRAQRQGFRVHVDVDLGD
jgi:hypothetical protein